MGKHQVDEQMYSTLDEVSEQSLGAAIDFSHAIVTSESVALIQSGGKKGIHD